jgi:hypothetical protein
VPDFDSEVSVLAIGNGLPTGLGFPALFMPAKRARDAVCRREHRCSALLQTGRVIIRFITSAWTVAGLLVLTAVVLAYSCLRIRRLEIRYTTD